MIEATQHKLREARFFFQRLDDERRQHSDGPEAFQFYLSAFINCARSIPWALQAEERKKYDLWLEVWESSLDDDDRKLLKITNDLRIKEKLGGADLIVALEPIAIAERLAADFKLHRWIETYGRNSSKLVIPAGEAKRPTHYLETKDGESEVTGICKKYLDYMERFVSEFIQAHPQTDAGD